jgi:hypothetical protein
MTAINGLIKNSLGEVLSGQLVVTLNDELTDASTSPNSLHLKEPVVYPVVNGVVGIEVLQSETQQVSYNFDFQMERDALDEDGNPTTVWESFFAFDAIVPNQASVDFTELQPTDFTPDQLDSGQFAVARVLATNETYRKNLQFRPSYQGVYSPFTVYKQDDLVTYDGSSFIYINGENTLGNPPPGYPSPSNAYWQVVGQRGNTGTGTTGNDTPYGVAWDGQTDAPSRGAIYDKIETLATIDNPSFTGTPETTQPSSGDASSRIPTTQWVATNYAPQNSPNFTGTPTAPTTPFSDVTNKVATTEFVNTRHNTDFFSVRLLNNYTDSNESNWNPKTIPLDGVLYDSAGGWDVQNSEYTVPTTGFWFFSGCYFVDLTDSTIRVISFFLEIPTKGRQITIFQRNHTNNKVGDTISSSSGSGGIILDSGDIIIPKVIVETASGTSTTLRLKAGISNRLQGVCLVRTA